MNAKQLIEQVTSGQDAYSVVKHLGEAEKYLKKMPPNTEIKGMLEWSSWDGYLALIYGPTYQSSGLADNTFFNAAQQARKYVVRFATDDRGKRLKVPEKAMLGYEISVLNRSAQYWETSWSWRRSTGPFYRGSFEKKTEEFLVGVDLKNLSPAETRSVASLYDSYGYIDFSGKAKIADVKKIFAKKKFLDTQDMDSDLANLAYELVRIKNGYRDPQDERGEQMVWDAIQGIYKISNKRDRIMWMVKK